MIIPYTPLSRILQVKIEMNIWGHFFQLVRCSFWLFELAGITLFVCKSEHYPGSWLCQIVIRNLWLDIFCEIPNPQTIKTASSINHQHNHVVEHFVWCVVSLFCCGQRYRLIPNWPFGHRGWWTVHNPAQTSSNLTPSQHWSWHVTCPVSSVHLCSIWM